MTAFVVLTRAYVRKGRMNLMGLIIVYYPEKVLYLLMEPWQEKISPLKIQNDNEVPGFNLHIVGL